MKKKHDPKSEPHEDPRVGEAIAMRRRALGLTQAQLAQMIDVGQEFISRIERKATPPKLDTLRKICDALNCSVDDLLQTGTPLDQTDEHLAAIAIAMRDLAPDERDSVVSIVRHVCEALTEHKRTMVPKVKTSKVVRKSK
ncbi:helix-turn-helix transcriptional regulator [Paraburkholderia sp. A1RI_3L]|uniref:helix-turn-helix domain-containing protein n=1 Tax=Paraburkholderia TaxID=1822464 RepID=UPI003B76200D